MLTMTPVQAAFARELQACFARDLYAAKLAPKTREVFAESFALAAAPTRRPSPAALTARTYPKQLAVKLPVSPVLYSHLATLTVAQATRFGFQPSAVADLAGKLGV